MTGPVISLRGLGKRLRRRRAGETLLAETLRALSGRVEEGWFWALRGVELDLAQGETLGVIGANGAGKSTLLKLVGGILVPDEGRVGVGGRVTALIELGAGFHAELSGRDNVFLNAAILGLSPAATRARFDSIVEFAELAHVIDSPIKHYSTGMHARLGFAVAIHLDPEVLLVDEVLSVGDISFQVKCQNWMRRYRSEGKSIFFVSHNLAAVETICNKVLWLESGAPKALGPPEDVIPRYLESMRSRSSAGARSAYEAGRLGTGEVRFTSIEILDEAGRPTTEVRPDAPFVVRCRYRAEKPVDDAVFRIRVTVPEYAVGVFSFLTRDEAPGPVRLEGEGELIARVERLPLEPGGYAIAASIQPSDLSSAYDLIVDDPRFRVVPGPKMDGVYLAHAELVRIPRTVEIRPLR